jgi:type I restriction enzyme R subunit
MAIMTKEIIFESEIEYSLIRDNEYIKGSPADFNREYAIDTAMLFRFLRESQPKEWDKLGTKHGAANAEANFLKRLHKDLENRGMLHLLRKGIVDAPAKFSLCFFRPATA